MHDHMFDIAFSVKSTEADPHKVPWHAIRASILARVALLDREPSEREAVGFCDSYEIEETP